MAQMHPPELPIAVLADSARRQDIAAFGLLAKALDNNFHVFYRPMVTGMVAEQHKVPDFIILHARHGLLGVAVIDDSKESGSGRVLPFASVRSAVRSLIFALKEQGIRFYIPAPCCAIFLHGQRADYLPVQNDMEYTPLFADELGEGLQDRITTLMPISAGYQSSWRVPDAVERITQFMQVATPLTQKNESVSAPKAAPASNDVAKQKTEPQRIVYVVRAVDIVLAFATIMAFIMLVTFVPEGAVRRFVDFSRSWSVTQTENGYNQP